VREARVAQRAQSLIDMIGQPRAMAELDRDRPSRQPGRERGEIVEPAGVEMDPRRELEENVAELAGLRDRLDGGPEEVERSIDGSTRRSRRAACARGSAAGGP